MPPQSPDLQNALDAALALDAGKRVALVDAIVNGKLSDEVTLADKIVVDGTAQGYSTGQMQPSIDAAVACEAPVAALAETFAHS